MKGLKYEFIGWCRESQSDKVWGAIELLGKTKLDVHPVNFKYLIF